MKKTADTWVMLGACNEGDDVLGVFNGEEPSQAEQQDVILRLPMYVYRSFRVQRATGRIHNRRGPNGRRRDVRPERTVQDE